ncbi:MAG: dihydrofolate reductase family protein [Actinomycetota bacterium]|nr:dihydrofolate reductase family protein [Actinomycetota bacterium]
MRVLIDHESGQAGERPDLTAAYAAPRQPWLRVNMVATLDGAGTGSDGRSGSINNPADKRVYDILRQLADAIVVGAGTARVEGYRVTDRPTVLVSRRGEVPEGLRGGVPGAVLLATCASSPGLVTARSVLGEDHVIVVGTDEVDLAEMKGRLVARGLTSLLSEGGPHLLRDLLDQGVADELCATIVPRLVGGDHTRITAGAGIEVPLRLRVLLEHDGTLLGRWFV